MTHVMRALGLVFVWASTAVAQDATGTVGLEGEVTEEASTDALEIGETGVAYEDKSPSHETDPDCLTKVYCKRVKGILWVEGTFGPAKFNATKFQASVLDGSGITPSVVVNGPEYGAAIGAQFDVFSIGVRFKYADFEPFDLLTAGLDFTWLLKIVPFAAPYVRLGLAYATTRNGTVVPLLDPRFDDPTTHGASFALGAGVRVPVIKWLSVAIGFDYSFIGLYLPDSGNYTVGGQIAGTFALTVHPI